MYAIVDIETTGGSAANGAITEVAIILHNGTHEEGRYTTLINPQMKVPYHITALTGIDNYMLQDAPLFEQMAPHLLNLLEGRIFVAHNVNFDHSFLHHQFRQLGMEWHTRKLCTVRYARKVFPGLASYSLGRLCAHLGIQVQQRHRALGDAAATALLFAHTLQADAEHKWLRELTKGRTAHSYLPMHVDKEVIDALPYAPGVYYFKDAAHKVLYVGKAINLKYRVKSHFSNNAAAAKRQDLIRKVHSIDYAACATPLMASVLESLEIKRLWPAYNKSQKEVQPAYGLYRVQLMGGHSRLVVEKKRKTLPALHSFYTLQEGYDMIGILARKLHTTAAVLLGQQAAPVLEQPHTLIDQAVEALHTFLPTLVLHQAGLSQLGEPVQVLYRLERGMFTGMGTTPAYHKVHSAAEAQAYIVPYPDNTFVRNMVLQEALQRPEQVWPLEVDSVPF